MEGLINSCPGALTGTSHSMFYQFINTMMATQCAFSQEGLYPENIAPLLKDGDNFDFIVVGAGSAGSVVANRLAENRNWKVLLLEAGGIPSSTTEVPFLYLSLLRTDEDWQYKTQPQDNACLGMKEKKCLWSAGKVLGGTGSINTLVHNRGDPREYDQWAAAGNEGWDYKSVLPYFKKSENAIELENSLDHGKGGYLEVRKYAFDDPIRKYIIDGHKELGYDYYDHEVSLGVFDGLITLNNGTRHSSGKAFLTTVHYQNLYLATKALVTKLIFDKSLTAAKGVQVKIGEKYVNLYATHEIVVSAGTVNSAHLLMTSGIGPQEHLEEMGIKVIRNLPVGENLQDRVHFSGFLVKLNDSMVKTRPIEDEVYEYFTARKGMFAHAASMNFASLIHTKKDSPFADIQFFYLTYARNNTKNFELFSDMYAYVDEIKHSKVSYNKETAVMEVLISSLHPKSRGKIRLASRDHLEKPLLFPNLLGDDDNEDLDTILGGVKFSMKLLETDVFSKTGIDVLQINIPNCNNITFKTDDYWRCAIRNMASSLFQSTSTCKMGVKEDRTAVVDSRLKVHGIDGLRIIDASVMPNIIGRNINAAIIMIAEKGADLIKQDWVK